MRKWRAENRDKNKRNDLRCRVYRLSRQKFGEADSQEKQQFIHEEINRRLGRRMLLETRQEDPLNELPFYSAPLHKIELPSINMNRYSSAQPSSPVSEGSVHSPTTTDSTILPPMQSFLTPPPSATS